MNIPSLEEMLSAGVHFGHKTSRWHPAMEPFLFGTRGGVHIIDLERTQRQLEEVLPAAKTMAEEGKTILFVGTKKQGQLIVKKYAQEAGMPYMVERWIGGLLTNFGEISRLIKKYNQLRKERAEGEWEKYTKKEQLDKTREIEKLTPMLEGITGLQKLPDALFVTDMRREKTALVEAARKQIPVIGICDSNVNPQRAALVIAANDDAVKSIEMMVSLVSGAIAEGRMEWEKKQAALPVKKAEVRPAQEPSSIKEVSE